MWLIINCNDFINKDIETGEIEVVINEFEILGTFKSSAKCGATFRS